MAHCKVKGETRNMVESASEQVGVTCDFGRKKDKRERWTKWAKRLW